MNYRIVISTPLYTRSTNRLRVPRLSAIGGYAKQAFRDRLIEHRQYIQIWGEDPPDIRDWRWRVGPG